MSAMNRLRLAVFSDEDLRIELQERDAERSPSFLVMRTMGSSDGGDPTRGKVALLGCGGFTIDFNLGISRMATMTICVPKERRPDMLPYVTWELVDKQGEIRGDGRIYT
jgi:hypothetical protein